jgi:hypothetical protein
MTGLKTTLDYERACRVAKKVIDQWDPYSLLAQGAPPDEFEALAASVVRFIPRMRSTEDAVRAVSEVFSEAFDGATFQPEHCREVGARLFGAFTEEGLLTK